MTVSTVSWAMEQRCDTPLEKMVLMYCADAFGMAMRSRVKRKRLVEFCCANDADILDAVRGLDLAGLIHWHALDPHWFDIELLASPAVIKANAP